MGRGARARPPHPAASRAAVAIAAALLLVVAGAATVNAVQGKGDHVDVAGVDHGGTTTTTEAPTSTTAATTTTTTQRRSGAAGRRRTTPTVTVPEAQPGDLTGTITPASTTWVAEQPALVALTLTNVSGHPVAFPKDIFRLVGLYMDYFDATMFKFEHPGAARSG